MQHLLIWLTPAVCRPLKKSNPCLASFWNTLHLIGISTGLSRMTVQRIPRNGSHWRNFFRYSDAILPRCWIIGWIIRCIPSGPNPPKSFQADDAVSKRISKRIMPSDSETFQLRLLFGQGLYRPLRGAQSIGF